MAAGLVLELSLNVEKKERDLEGRGSPEKSEYRVLGPQRDLAQTPLDNNLFDRFSGSGGCRCAAR